MTGLGSAAAVVLLCIGAGMMTFILWLASGSVSMANGVWNAAMDECYNGTGVVLISDAPKVGVNTNPFAIITGDYYFDCTKDVPIKNGDVINLETLKLKTIHVKRGLI
jgi:hypothetical protein